MSISSMSGSKWPTEHRGELKRAPYGVRAFCCYHARMSLRSLFGGLVNESPVPLVSRWQGGLGMGGGLFSGRGRRAAIDSMSATPTLFGVVKKLSRSTAGVEWDLCRKPARPGDEPTPLTGGRAENAAPLKVWNSPNPAPHMSAVNFRQGSQQHKELCGEFWWVVLKVAGVPVELWPVRPDRMEPVSSATKLVAGYIYTSPDGEQVPLDVEDVIVSIDPSSDDPLRGASPIGALASDLGQSRAQARWQESMYRNAAQPGGIIRVNRRLGDSEWQSLVERWRFQHQGEQNAGRVAVLEDADFTPLSYAHKDMQFVESRGLTRQAIFDAYGFPKFGIGDVDDVNRASADASLAMFTQTLIVPRLEDMRTVLNTRFLPMFGPAWRGYEFNYRDPVPPDAESDRADLAAKVSAFQTLRAAGVNADDAAKICGLPPMRIEVKVPPTPEVAQDSEDSESGEEDGQ